MQWSGVWNFPYSLDADFFLLALIFLCNVTGANFFLCRTNFLVFRRRIFIWYHCVLVAGSVCGAIKKKWSQRPLCNFFVLVEKIYKQKLLRYCKSNRRQGAPLQKITVFETTKPGENLKGKMWENFKAQNLRKNFKP